MCRAWVIQFIVLCVDQGKGLVQIKCTHVTIEKVCRGGACCWEGRGMLLGGEGHVVGRGGHVVGRGGHVGHVEGGEDFLGGEGHI